MYQYRKGILVYLCVGKFLFHLCQGVESDILFIVISLILLMY